MNAAIQNILSKEYTSDELFNISLENIYKSLDYINDLKKYSDVISSVDASLENMKEIYNTLRKEYAKLSESLAYRIEEAQEYGMLLEKLKNPTERYILCKFNLDNDFNLDDVKQLKF